MKISDTKNKILKYFINRYQKQHFRKNQNNISILIPAYNEVENILICIDTIINNHYPHKLEIIIIDDGINDEITHLLFNTYSFIPYKRYKETIKTQTIKNIYVTYRKHTRLYLINKENGLKADALNAGINLSHYLNILMLDADTLLCEHALSQLMASKVDSVIAVGGRIKVDLTNSTSLINRLFTLIQYFEYNINFIFNRVSLTNINALPILSGALTLVGKDILLSIGGLDTHTLGEDFDLTLRLYEYALKHHQHIIYERNAVCMTEVPYNLKNWFKQRIRWHRGFLEVIHQHFNLLFKHQNISYVLLIIYLYEHIFVFIEIIGLIKFSYTTLVFILISTLLTWNIYFLLSLKECHMTFFEIIFMYPMLILYHFCSVISKLLATFIYILTLKNKNKHWGIQERKK